MVVFNENRFIYSANMNGTELTIIFKNNMKHIYINVEKQIYDDLINSENPILFFNENIKNKYEVNITEPVTNDDESPEDG